MGTKTRKQATRAQTTLLDFIEGGANPAKGAVKVAQAAERAQPKEREEELLQKLIELCERHNRCLKKDDVVSELGISKVAAVKLLNELVKAGYLMKRLNDEGELVYCKRG